MVPGRLETDAKGMISWRRGRWWYPACLVAQNNMDRSTGTGAVREGAIVALSSALWHKANLAIKEG
jgi:hypothetical protein